jgi:hypothetical protein
MAFAESLDEALPPRVRTTIEWLAAHGGLDRCDAYALCSMGEIPFSSDRERLWAAYPVCAAH